MNQGLILHNIVNLSMGEIVSRLLNFISFVYLARVILADGFGIISFVVAFSSYFLLIVNFSSDLIASREVARLQENKEIFVERIISTRMLLAIASYALFFVLVMLLQTTSIIRIFLLIYGLTFFAQAINISWYFRGMEKTLAATVAQIFSSLINLVLIVTLVNDKTELVYSISIITTAAFITSLLLLGLYKRDQKKRLILDAGFGSEKKGSSILDSGFMRRNLSESFPVAFAGLMISIYYNLDHVMLGYMTSSTELGYYAAAYKIIIVALVPAGIIYQAFLPQLSKSINDFGLRSNLMEAYSRSMLTAGAFFTTIIFLFAKKIIGITYGTQYGNSIMLTQLLAFNIFLVYLNMTYGNPLIAWNKQKVYSYSIVLGAVVNIILNIVLIPKYSAAGAAIATISSELAVMVGIIPTHFYFTRKIHIKTMMKSIGCVAITGIVIISLESYLADILRTLIALILFLFLVYVFRLTQQFSMKNIYS